MNSNRIFMFSTLCALAIVVVLIGIYALTNVQSLTSSALTDHGEKKQNERLAKLSLPRSQVSGTVLDVAGQTVAVQEAGNPCTISFVYVNGNFPAGLAPGKTVIMNGEFKNGLFDTDNITITESTPGTPPDTSPKPIGLVDRMIFFITYWVS
jgi:cytochrome c-type biogenesis protein CcmE